jgi:outer membrane protein TolC
LFDKPQSYKVAKAQEATNGATISIAMRQEDAAYRVTSAFLNAESAVRRATAARQQAANLQEVLRIVETRVANGQELDIERKKANHSLNVAKDAVEAFEATDASIELELSQILGFPAGDQVRPAMELRDIQVLPLETESVSKAIGQSTEIQRLQSEMRELRLQIKSYQAERLPKINFFSLQAILRELQNEQRADRRVLRNSHSHRTGAQGRHCAGTAGHRQTGHPNSADAEPHYGGYPPVLREFETRRVHARSAP